MDNKLWSLLDPNGKFKEPQAQTKTLLINKFYIKVTCDILNNHFHRKVIQRRDLDGTTIPWAKITEIFPNLQQL